MKYLLPPVKTYFKASLHTHSTVSDGKMTPEQVKELYKDEQVNDIDGVKIDFPDRWVHLRKSNTEPIIRVYSEASTMEVADELGKQIMDVVYSLA